MINRILFLTLAIALIPTKGANADSRPNILWIVVEDMSCHFGYQGEELVDTPHVDRLAREGVVFDNAYVTAPVCSTARSALITGIYQTTIGAHHHRSSRGELQIELPEGMNTIPEMLRESGYYTTNSSISGDRPGKEDYNFVYDRSDLYDGVDWSKRAQGQPFFAQVQLRGGKLRNVSKWYGEIRTELEDLVTSEQISLPPYYPDHPVIREDWAAYLNAVQYTDKEVGQILQRLKKEKVLENTIIFFLTDHGISHARGKQFLYDEGARIPFIVWAPGRLQEAVKRDDLVAHIDVAASSLYFAGIEVPQTMQARPLFGPEASKREYVVSARDRCDETVDRIRMIRKEAYKYIRNYHPQRPYLQPCAYKDHKPFTPVLRKMFAAGELNGAQTLQLAETRPKEELYDLRVDPFEIDNLADNPDFQERLHELRELLERWESETDDLGRFPESEAMYDSDMKAYLNSRMRKSKPGYVAEVEANISQMKRWRAEGK